MKKLIRNFLSKYKFVQGDINRNDRIGMLHKCWGHVFSNHLFGDYVEFGVYKGDTLVQSVKQYKQYKSWLNDQKRSNEKWRVDIALKSDLNNQIYFHGLDTFEGMPENNERNFIYNKGSFISSYEETQKKMLSLKEKIFLYEGVFKNQKKHLVNNLKNRKVSIVNIDCDIYSSTIDSLEIINEYMQIGSIILFDDYNGFNANNEEGQRKALAEFKMKTNWVIEPFFTYMYSGQSFIICGRK